MISSTEHIRLLSLSNEELKKEIAFLKKVQAQKTEEAEAWQEHLRGIIKKQNLKIDELLERIDSIKGQTRLKFTK